MCVPCFLVSEEKKKIMERFLGELTFSLFFFGTWRRLLCDVKATFFALSRAYHIHVIRRCAAEFIIRKFAMLPSNLVYTNFFSAVFG